MRYEYPLAKDSRSAWLQFLKEHGRHPNHCFQNTWGRGYILFDTKEEVNAWYEEHTGHYFYKDEPKPGAVYTRQDAYNEIKDAYGRDIDKLLSNRDCSKNLLVVGLPSSTAFGNEMFLCFISEQERGNTSPRLFMHYDVRYLDVSSMTDLSVKETLIKLLYDHFYNAQFKKKTT